MCSLTAFRKTCLTLAVVIATACSDTSGSSPEPEVAEVRLEYGFGNAITVSSGCAVTPATGLLLTVNNPTTISASFYRADGTKDPVVTIASFRLSGIGAAEPQPTPNTIEWTRVFQIAGMLTPTAPADGFVRLSLYHVDRDHTDWGPCLIPLDVQEPAAPAQQRSNGQ